MQRMVEFIFSLLLIESLCAKELTKEDVKIFSEYVGKNIGKGLKSLEGYYDMDALIHGLKNQNGKRDDLDLTEEEIDEKVLALQNEIFEKKAAENLQKAELVLEGLTRNPKVTVISEKLVYERLKEGLGVPVVEENSTPLLHYAAVTLDDAEIINTFKDSEPQTIPLIETISGFAKGIVGMKEGERRKLYIHPDLAYRKTGYLPPNSLLIIEVEVVKVHQS